MMTRWQGSLNRTQAGELFEGHLVHSPDKTAGQTRSYNYMVRVESSN